MTTTKQMNMRISDETRAQMEELRQRLERWKHALADSEAAAAAKHGFSPSIKRRRASSADVIRWALNSLAKDLPKMEEALASFRRVVAPEPFGKAPVPASAVWSSPKGAR